MDIAAPGDLHWVPTPKHVMRQSCIRSLTQQLVPGRFLEIGPGNGSLTVDFLARGFRGVCFDIGEQTRAWLRARLAPFGERAGVVDDLQSLEALSFDYVFAFEVLEYIEYIEDAAAALRHWDGMLRPGGYCVVSVPAHQRKFGLDDVAVGHVRRYEKAQLLALFAGAGYTDLQIRNYGFPLGNMTRWVANLLRRHHGPADGSRVERSIRSGVERPPVTRALSALFNRSLLGPFLLLQRLFYSRDWGDGYVLLARKGAALPRE